jgi:hypothetical protein
MKRFLNFMFQPILFLPKLERRRQCLMPFGHCGFLKVCRKKGPSRNRQSFYGTGGFVNGGINFEHRVR